MKIKNYDEDFRFKIRQRYATISDWMSKTIDSERVPEPRARSQYGAPIKIQTPVMISLQNPQQPHNHPRSIDTVLKHKPRIARSQQPTQQSSKLYARLIDPHLVTRSIDYSDLCESYAKTKKRKPPQNQRLNRQFQTIYNKMKLILDSYKSREKILLGQIAKLRKEIVTLKSNNQTI